MQAQQRLAQHYNDKYKAEVEQKTDDFCMVRKYPQTRVEACLKYFPKYFNGGTVLELGAGSGTLARSFLAAELKFTSYTISDFSAVRVEGMRKSITDPRLQVTQINCEDIPVDELPKFDAVIMMALIEHLVDPLGAMQKVNQLLKPDGFVYLDTPNMALYHRRLKLLRGIFPSTASKNEGLTTYDNKAVDLYDEGHLHYFTYGALSKMLIERCGFSSVKKLGYFSNPFLGRAFGDKLANYWPELFSELTLLAFK